MTLKFGWEWESAPDVEAPELAATWSRLAIEIVGVTATLVEERFSAHGIRKSIDVPTYPLAEWMAFNWWMMLAPKAPKTVSGFNLSGAGDGFPWPDLTLIAGPGAVSASLLRKDRDPDFVRFLSSVDAVLDPQETAAEMGRFIDATVRRLEDSDVGDTPLQLEWQAINAADAPERAFCLAAACLGLDPYDLEDAQTKQILRLESLTDTQLQLDLAGSVDLAGLESAQEWVEAALARAHEVTGPPFQVEAEPLPFGERVPPWKVGYERARRLRDRLQVGADERIELQDVVGIITLDRDVPATIGGLVDAREQATTVAMPRTGPTARRFTGARAVGRRTFDSHVGEILLTATHHPYAEKVERAFAAEFLAPAAGVAELLGGDRSEEAQVRAARHLDVDLRVIEHQVENQLLG